MFEVIKNLKPIERFYAFLIAALLSSSTAILTVYLNTDDCSGISNQYEVLVTNHTKLMTINNILIDENNKKQEDIIKIQQLLETITQSKPIVETSTTVKSEPSPLTNIAAYTITPSTDSLPQVMDMVILPPKTKVIEKKTVIRDVPKNQKSIINSILKITRIYDKK